VCVKELFIVVKKACKNSPGVKSKEEGDRWRNTEEAVGPRK
jgi:hypothetical protein